MKALHSFQLKQSCPRFNSLVACLSQPNRSVWLGQGTRRQATAPSIPASPQSKGTCRPSIRSMPAAKRARPPSAARAGRLTVRQQRRRPNVRRKTVFGVQGARNRARPRETRRTAKPSTAIDRAVVRNAGSARCQLHSRFCARRRGWRASRLSFGRSPLLCAAKISPGTGKQRGQVHARIL